MPFPESVRVLYGANPLDEVICQVRFTPILRIAAEVPAAFQERIRDRYPEFRENPMPSQLPFAVPAAIAQQIGVQFGARGGGNYNFISDDGHWTVGLTTEFLSLSTDAYERWESFVAQLDAPLRGVVEVYKPQYFTRIGLRYRDVIRRSKLGLENTPWGELLRPHIAAEIAQPEIADLITTSAKHSIIRLSTGAGQVTLQHGLVNDDLTGEQCYLIDSDFHTSGHTGVTDVYNVLNSFNRISGRLFRWCITPALHEAMRPQPI